MRCVKIDAEPYAMLTSIEVGDTRIWTGEAYRLNFNFYLVGQGLPEENPSASIPVFPNAYHPDERPAVEPVGALPWDNLYIHSYYNFLAMVSRMHYTTDVRTTRYPKELRSQLLAHVMRDKMALDRLRAAAAEAAAASKPPASESALQASAQDSQSRSAHSRHTGAAGLFDVPEALDPDDPAYVVNERLSKTDVCVEMWVDIHAYPGPITLEPPGNFYPQLAKLKRCVYLFA